jgi:hypothetical protein
MTKSRYEKAIEARFTMEPTPGFRTHEEDLEDLTELASAFHGVSVADAAGYARSPLKQGECGCVKVAVPAQGGHLGGAGYQLAVPVRSHH